MCLGPYENAQLSLQQDRPNLHEFENERRMWMRIHQVQTMYINMFYRYRIYSLIHAKVL